jgi:hypothetical protein
MALQVRCRKFQFVPMFVKMVEMVAVGRQLVEH